MKTQIRKVFTGSLLLPMLLSFSVLNICAQGNDDSSVTEIDDISEEDIQKVEEDSLKESDPEELVPNQEDVNSLELYVPALEETILDLEIPTVTPSMTRASLELRNRYVKPDFSNWEAYGKNNVYTESNLGQCTWYTWGRFYEVYGYSPGFTGFGYECVNQLVASHPDKFEIGDVPKIGTIFSADMEHSHVGMIIGIEEDLLVVQEGNLDQRNNFIYEVENDYWIQTYTMDQLHEAYGNVIFANPFNTPELSKLVVRTEKESARELSQDQLRLHKEDLILRRNHIGKVRNF